MINAAARSHRVATFLMYLKEPEAGGETAFPRSAATAAATTAAMSQGISLPYGSHIEGFAELMCATDTTLKVVPRAGDAILMWNYALRTGPNGQEEDEEPSGSAFAGTARSHAVVDLTALHASCPVLAGEKWVATKWMRSSLYKPLFYLTDDKADSEQSGG